MYLFAFGLLVNTRLYALCKPRLVTEAQSRSEPNWLFPRAAKVLLGMATVCTLHAERSSKQSLNPYPALRALQRESPATHFHLCKQRFGVSLRRVPLGLRVLDWQFPSLANPHRGAVNASHLK